MIGFAVILSMVEDMDSLFHLVRNEVLGLINSDHVYPDAFIPPVSRDKYLQRASPFLPMHQLLFRFHLNKRGGGEPRSWKKFGFSFRKRSKSARTSSAVRLT